MYIRLGNTHPREGYFATKQDELNNVRSYRELPGPSITTLTPPDTISFSELLVGLNQCPLGIWFEHAQHELAEDGVTWTPAAPPAWVASDDPKLQRRLAAVYDCPEGEPDGYLPADSVRAAADKDLPGVDHTAPADDGNGDGDA